MKYEAIVEYTRDSIAEQFATTLDDERLVIPLDEAARGRAERYVEAHYDGQAFKVTRVTLRRAL